MPCSTSCCHSLLSAWIFYPKIQNSLLQAHLLVLEEKASIHSDLRSGSSSPLTSSQSNANSDAPTLHAAFKKKRLPERGPGHSRPKTLTVQPIKPTPPSAPRISTRRKGAHPSEYPIYKRIKEMLPEKEPQYATIMAVPSPTRNKSSSALPTTMTHSGPSVCRISHFGQDPHLTTSQKSPVNTPAPTSCALQKPLTVATPYP